MKGYNFDWLNDLTDEEQKAIAKMLTIFLPENESSENTSESETIQAT